jgi:hypothetical protein
MSMVHFRRLNKDAFSFFLFCRRALCCLGLFYVGLFSVRTFSKKKELLRAELKRKSDCTDSLAPAYSPTIIINSQHGAISFLSFIVYQ